MHFFTYFRLFFLFISISISAQNWIQRQSHPGVERHHPVTFTINNMGYLLTGSTASGFANDFHQYNPATDTWTTLPNFAGSARSYAYGVASQNKAYVGFGLSANGYLNDLWEYNADNGTWNQLASCPCSARIHPAFVIQGGKIFVGLGNNQTNLNDWWEYNIATDTWSQLPNFPGAPRHHPYHFAVGGHVYVGFGHGAGIYKDWYRWNLTTSNWTQMNDLPGQSRVAGTQFNIGDRGFVLSGDGSNHSAMPTGEFWEYDYQTDAWSALPPHPGVSRWAPGSFVIGNVVYFTSGEIYAGNPNAGLKKDLWSFDLDVLSTINHTDGTKTKIRAYPNPADNFLMLSDLTNFENVSLDVYDSTGKKVKNTFFNGHVLDVSALSTGLFFIVVKENDVVVEKISFLKK